MKKKHVVHHRKAPSIWTSVTPVSRVLAFILFIVLPLIAFILGMNYERALTILNSVSRDTEVRFEKLPSPTTPSGY